MNFLYFIRNMLQEIFSLIRKCLYFLSNYVIILFVCLALYLSFFHIIFNFIRYPMLSSILSSIFQMRIFSQIIKYIHFLSQLNFNYIYMVLIVFESFSKKSLILYIILYNPQFYHTYVRGKYSFLYENFSTSFSIKF